MDNPTKQELEQIEIEEEHVEVCTDSISIYLKQIGKIPLLQHDEELELSKKIQNKIPILDNLKKLNIQPDELPTTIQDLKAKQAVTSKQKKGALTKKINTLSEYQHSLDEAEKARQKLMSSNLRLVVSIAKRYAGRGLSLQDMVQEGNLGLMKAVEKYDYKLDFKFSTYATWWIKQSITRAIADQAKMIRIPVHMVEKMNKYTYEVKKFLQEQGREPSTKEIAEIMNLPEEKVYELITLFPDPISLEITVGEDNDSELVDFISSGCNDLSDELNQTLLSEEIQKLLSESLSEKEQEVIRFRFGIGCEPKTLEEVGKIYNRTRERIRQIEGRAIRKLRIAAKRKKMKDFLI